MSKRSRATRKKATVKPMRAPHKKMRKAEAQHAQHRASNSPKRVSQRRVRVRVRASTGEFIAKPLVLPDGRVMPSVQMMARGVGVGAGHLSKVMNGKNNISLHLAHRWAGFLGVSLDVLYAVLYGPGGVVPKKEKKGTHP